MNLVNSTLVSATALSLVVGQANGQEVYLALFDLGPAEYTAEFEPLENGNYNFVLVPTSDNASSIDKLSSSDFRAAISQAQDFLLDVSNSTIEEQILGRLGLDIAKSASENLVESAFYEAVSTPSLDLSTTGLSVGFAPVQGAAHSTVFASVAWGEGTAFVVPGIELESDSVVLAQFNPETVAGLDVARMREIAKNAAEEMFASAALTACNSNPRPSQISPSISVSFNFFAGAEFSISAMYEVETLCKTIARP